MSDSNKPPDRTTPTSASTNESDIVSLILRHVRTEPPYDEYKKYFYYYLLVKNRDITLRHMRVRWSTEVLHRRLTNGREKLLNRLLIKEDENNFVHFTYTLSRANGDKISTTYNVYPASSLHTTEEFEMDPQILEALDAAVTIRPGHSLVTRSQTPIQFNLGGVYDLQSGARSEPESHSQSELEPPGESTRTLDILTSSHAATQSKKDLESNVSRVA